MNKNIFAAIISVASFSAGSVFGVGPDSNGAGTQDYSYILDSGRSIAITRSAVTPKVSGTHPEGYALNNPYATASGISMSAKWDYSGTSIGISTSSPYLVDLTYADGALTNTGAKVTSSETAIIASRALSGNVKVFGGVRLNQYKATLNKPFLGGAGNPTMTVAGGYQFTLNSGTNTGFALGAAYEIPEIYLRASIQYNSEITHKKAAVSETLGGATTASTNDGIISPSSMIIKLRSAITPKIIAFANWRSSQYKKFVISGPVHTAAGQGDIYNPESGTDYTIGAAIVLSDQLTAIVGTSKGQSTDTGALANALTPFKGSSNTFIGASLKVTDTIELNASYALISFGDENAGVPLSTGAGGAAAFTDNKGSRISIGTKISF